MENLSLNFTLLSQTERAADARRALTELNRDPTQREIAQIADYILWGTDPQGNRVPADFGLETRWQNGRRNEVSLEGLQCSLAFNEATLRPLFASAGASFAGASTAKTVVKKQTFDRDEARANASPEALASLEALWSLIDALEAAPERARSPYQRTLAHRRLIGLKTEQYALRATYTARHTRHQFTRADTYDPSNWTEELRLRPLGAVRLGDPAQGRYTSKYEAPLRDPNDIQEARQLAAALAAEATEPALDFRDPAQLRALFRYYSKGEPLPETVAEPLNYYFERASLTPIQRDVAVAKMRGLSNTEAAAIVNARNNTYYRSGYISIIWNKQVLGAIAAAAQTHYDTFELLDQPDEWRQCNCCGALKPLLPAYWTRRRDDYVGMCKVCEKKRRQERKN